MKALSTFLAELWKRRVVQFGVLYLGAAWVLLQVAIAVETAAELPHWVDQTMLVFLVLGFPVVLILAWAQETRTDQDVNQSVQKLDRMSVVVLPFTNLTGDDELDVILAGLTEDFIGGLGRHQTLKVVGRHSSSKYAHQAVDFREVGRDLETAYAYEGSLQKRAAILRFTLQLVECSTGLQVWTTTYEAESSDFDRLRTELTSPAMRQLLGQALNAHLTHAFSLSDGFDAKNLTRSCTVSELCHIAHWRAQGFAGRVQIQNIPDAVALLEHATYLKPNDPLSNSLLAFYLAVSALSLQAEDPYAARLRAQELFEKALSQRSTHSLVAIHSHVTACLLGRFSQSYSLVRQLVAELGDSFLQANPEVTEQYNFLATLFGDQPVVSARSVSSPANSLLGADDPEQALAAARTYFEINPDDDFFGARFFLILALAMAGREREGREAVDEFLRQKRPLPPLIASSILAVSDSADANLGSAKLAFKGIAEGLFRIIEGAGLEALLKETAERLGVDYSKLPHRAQGTGNSA